jgi:hypothetical protein
MTASEGTSTLDGRENTSMSVGTGGGGGRACLGAMRIEDRFELTNDELRCSRPALSAEIGGIPWAQLCARHCAGRGAHRGALGEAIAPSCQRTGQVQRSTERRQERLVSCARRIQVCGVTRRRGACRARGHKCCCWNLPPLPPHLASIGSRHRRIWEMEVTQMTNKIWRLRAALSVKARGRRRECALVLAVVGGDRCEHMFAPRDS